MLPVTIIPMRAEHLPEVLMIERDSFSTPWSEQSFRNELNNLSGPGFRPPGSRPYVAMFEGEVAGYICTGQTLDEGHILNLAVRMDFRRSGVAKALVLKALEDFKASGCLRIFLEVRASNRAAIGLYESFGFKAIGARSLYYVLPLEDAIVMSKDLKDYDGLASM